MSEVQGLSKETFSYEGGSSAKDQNNFLASKLKDKSDTVVTVVNEFSRNRWVVYFIPA